MALQRLRIEKGKNLINIHDNNLQHREKQLKKRESELFKREQEIEDKAQRQNLQSQGLSELKTNKVQDREGQSRSRKDTGSIFQ